MASIAFSAHRKDLPSLTHEGGGRDGRREIHSYISQGLDGNEIRPVASMKAVTKRTCVSAASRTWTCRSGLTALAKSAGKHPYIGKVRIYDGPRLVCRPGAKILGRGGRGSVGALERDRDEGAGIRTVHSVCAMCLVECVEVCVCEERALYV